MSEVQNEVRPRRLGTAVIGIATMVLGVLAMLTPLFTGLSVVFIVGLIVLAGGIVRLVWALQSSPSDHKTFKMVVSILTLLCGLLLTLNPVFASAVLTLLLAIYFVFDGVLEIATALNRRPDRGWGWLLAGGIASLLLGVIAWRQYPLSGAWAIGVLLGLKLCFIGLIMFTVGSRVRATS
jgi:uncharacterized membrane protein HdeD (DUF308 family)